MADKTYKIRINFSDSSYSDSASFTVPQGPKGIAGDSTINQGATGLGWTWGTAVPSITAGRAGESFLLCTYASLMYTTEGKVYVTNSSGAYTYSYSIKGPAGNTGDTGTSGAYPTSVSVTEVS